MSQHAKIASRVLLKPYTIEVSELVTVLQSALFRGVDYADLFLQHSQEESWALEESLVKSGSYSVDSGFGLRVVKGDQTGFAYADNLQLAAIQRAARTVKKLGQSGRMGPTSLKTPRSLKLVNPLYEPVNPLQSWTDAKKVHFLQHLDQALRDRDPRVCQVMLRLSSEYDVVMVLNHEGQLVSDVRPMAGLWVKVVVEEHGRREHGMSGAGGRGNYETVLTPTTIQSCMDKALHQALINLEAKPAPAGTMPVVLGPGWPGVLLHEAIGHGLEGDFNRKGTSAFSNRIGERVASEVCTVVDDGTLAGRRGCITVDDEGTPSQCTTLIERGILCGYMQDRMNARLMNMHPTGNGRRESYAHLPLPRMTNTYMLAGHSSPEEIIKSVERGIYAVDFSGGQVDITSGKFVFSASEAYMIEGGKITHPVKGVTLIGDGPTVLTKVSMVGNDLQLDRGIGHCGKAGQSIPVGVGQPTLKIDELTVGGCEVC